MRQRKCGAVLRGGLTTFEAAPFALSGQEEDENAADELERAVRAPRGPAADDRLRADGVLTPPTVMHNSELCPTQRGRIHTVRAGGWPYWRTNTTQFHRQEDVATPSHQAPGMRLTVPTITGNIVSAASVR